MILNAIKQVYKRKSNFIVSIIIFIVSFSFYILAIDSTGSVELFFKESPLSLVVSQILFSFLNALLIAVAITLFIEIFRKRKAEKDLSILGAITALFFSVATTGCYVCGTVLLPALGIGASFATLPFGGLEIKVLTVLLLIYSVRELSKTLLGICDLKKFKIYKIDFGSKDIKINGRFFYQVRPVIITLLFIIAIIALPSITPESLRKEVNSENVCIHTK